MRILIVTDGSPSAEAALRFGGHTLGALRDSEPPTILTVVKHEADRPQADLILTHARELLAPLNAQTRVRVGHPAEEIIHEAEEGDYDLAIVGERQDHNPVTRFLLGSTAVRVAKHAPCPVIVAKGKVGPIRRILLCDSGSEIPPLLGRFTAQLAELIEGEEEVTVLHVMSQISAGPGVRGKQLRAKAKELIEEHTPEGELLERGVRVLDRPGIHPRPKVRHGLVVDEILKEAQRGDYDLVVIGAHRGAGWRRILLDDLARKIMIQLDRPALVVR